MAIILTMGRGGTGKTTFVALTTKYLIEIAQTPILLMDLDPDQNLGDMVGVDMEKLGKSTIADLVYEAFLDGGGTLIGVPPSERMESKIWDKGLYEGKAFDFITIGTKWVEGCYCLPNAALKKALETLSKTYRHILIDSPAGLEHLNRRITSNIDDIFDILDPSKKSFEHIKRAYRVIDEVGIVFKNFYVIGGYRFPKDFREDLFNKNNFKFLGKIEYDKEVEEYVLAGQSLLNVSSSSPAYKSVKKIVSQAGYF